MGETINPGRAMTPALARLILADWNEDKDRITPGRYKYDLHAMIGAYLAAAAEVERLRVERDALQTALTYLVDPTAPAPASAEQ